MEVYLSVLVYVLIVSIAGFIVLLLISLLINPPEGIMSRNPLGVPMKGSPSPISELEERFEYARRKRAKALVIALLIVFGIAAYKLIV